MKKLVIDVVFGLVMVAFGAGIVAQEKTPLMRMADDMSALADIKPLNKPRLKMPPSEAVFIRLAGSLLELSQTNTIAARVFEKAADIAGLFEETPPPDTNFIAWESISNFIATATNHFVCDATNAISFYTEIELDDGAKVSPSMTNGLCVLSVSPANLTNLVQHLAAKGHVCAVKGHNWRDGHSIDPDPETVEPGQVITRIAIYIPPGVYRTCRLCGVCQSKSETWK